MLEINDRTLRKNNIVIREAKIEKENPKDWTIEFLRNKLNVEGGIENAWRSGPVIIAKVESWEKKMVIWKNKAKLKDSEIYIEHDLSWVERKKQETILKWAREQREKGIEVKVGFGKVRVNGVWSLWEKV